MKREEEKNRQEIKKQGELPDKMKKEKGRKGEAALPLYKGKCAPVPIVCQADRQPWGAEQEQ